MRTLRTGLAAPALTTLLVACGGSSSDPAPCNVVPHGVTETRIRYESATVPDGSECIPEAQTRTCQDGAWSAWSGTYAHESCTIETFASCGDTPHGDTEERIRYQSESVPAGSLCVSEVQTRTCEHGTWTDWSGTFTYESCAVGDFAPCGDIPHGGTEERTRYESDSVPAGSTCVSETQTRTCDDGAWTDWSGTYAYTDCTVMDYASCGDTPHGGTEERIRYQSEMVPSDALCVPETQTRTCDNGTWTDWSGTYTHEICSVEGFANCQNTPHGTTLERTHYASWTVMPDSECEAQLQTNTCYDGTWTGWSGTYGYPECHRGCWREPSGWSQHGTTQSRIRYREETPPAGQACESETQTRTCDDGTWTDWSGTYTYEECTDGAPCGELPHGYIRYRTRYESASVPAGSSCVSEVQASTCDDGTWTDWTGTYTYEDCTVGSSGGGVATCDQSQLYGTCHEFSGPNASSDVQAACSIGTIGTSCPGGAVGVCDLSNLGTNPPGYRVYYYICYILPDVETAEASCASAGGAWSAL